MAQDAPTDRGMTSAENIEWLQQTGRRYLIGTAKSELRKWARAIAEGQDWQSVRDGIEARLCSGPDGKETFVLCRSAERREKEQAIHARFAQRIEPGWISSAGTLSVRAKRSSAENRSGRSDAYWGATHAPQAAI
jgi:hypothetical protein